MTLEMRQTCPGAPLQYEGSVDGYPFYFRSRWDDWSFEIIEAGVVPWWLRKDEGPLEATRPIFYRTAEYLEAGTASWMPAEVGEAFIARAADEFREWLAAGRPQPTSGMPVPLEELTPEEQKERYDAIMKQETARMLSMLDNPPSMLTKLSKLGEIVREAKTNKGGKYLSVPILYDTAEGAEPWLLPPSSP